MPSPPCSSAIARAGQYSSTMRSQIDAGSPLPSNTARTAAGGHTLASTDRTLSRSSDSSGDRSRSISAPQPPADAVPILRKSQLTTLSGTTRSQA